MKIIFGIKIKQVYIYYNKAVSFDRNIERVYNKFMKGMLRVCGW